MQAETPNVGGQPRLATPEVQRKVGVAPHTVNIETFIGVKFHIFVRQYSVTKAIKKWNILDSNKYCVAQPRYTQ